VLGQAPDPSASLSSLGENSQSQDADQPTELAADQPGGKEGGAEEIHKEADPPVEPDAVVSNPADGLLAADAPPPSEPVPLDKPPEILAEAAAEVPQPPDEAAAPPGGNPPVAVEAAPEVAAVEVEVAEVDHEVNPPEEDDDILGAKIRNGKPVSEISGDVMVYFGEDGFDCDGFDKMGHRRGDWNDCIPEKKEGGRNKYGYVLKKSGHGRRSRLDLERDDAAWNDYSVGGIFNVFGYSQAGKLAKDWRDYSCKGEVGDVPSDFNRWGIDCYGRRRTDITVTIKGEIEAPQVDLETVAAEETVALEPLPADATIEVESGCKCGKSSDVYGRDNYNRSGYRFRARPLSTPSQRRADWHDGITFVNDEWRNKYGYTFIKNATGIFVATTSLISSEWTRHDVGGFNVFGWNKDGYCAQDWRAYEYAGTCGGVSDAFNKYGYNCYGQKADIAPVVTAAVVQKPAAKAAQSVVQGKPAQGGNGRKGKRNKGK
jgi:hypothetical protein